MTAEDAAPQLVPLNAIFATDFVQILVPVTTANTMREVAAAVAHHVEGKRVRALPYDKVVIYRGERMPADMTVAADLSPALLEIAIHLTDGRRARFVQRDASLTAHWLEGQTLNTF